MPSAPLRTLEELGLWKQLPQDLRKSGAGDLGMVLPPTALIKPTLRVNDGPAGAAARRRPGRVESVDGQAQRLEPVVLIYRTIRGTPFWSF